MGEPAEVPESSTNDFALLNVAAWLGALPSDSATALKKLGELLVGVTDQTPKRVDANQFTLETLGVDTFGDVVDEVVELSSVGRLTFALALAELIGEHSAEIGPGDLTLPPSYTRTTVGDTVYRHPHFMRVGFPAGTLLEETACVLLLDGRGQYGSPPEIAVFIRREYQDSAREILDKLSARAGELNPYARRVCRASYRNGLTLSVIDLPTNLTRETVVVAAEVWQEVDIGIRSVRDRHELLNSHGLGARRGVLLAGPPGVGKSAVSAAIANELVGEFSVIYVEARAGEQLLTAVVEEAKRLGGPVLLILEDVDLWCRERLRGQSGGLSELLQAMDIAPDSRLLTIASTNDASTLDRAAIRTGRFDSIVEVAFPNRQDAERILVSLMSGIPGGAGVDTRAVAAALPDQTSGSDLREIVRRAVLSTSDGELSTQSVMKEVGSGRYQAQLPAEGAYL